MCCDIWNQYYPEQLCTNRYHESKSISKKISAIQEIPNHYSQRKQITDSGRHVIKKKIYHLKALDTACLTGFCLKNRLHLKPQNY